MLMFVLLRREVLTNNNSIYRHNFKAKPIYFVEYLSKCHKPTLK